jgi:membrane-associated phospholipid phosphatase
MLKDRFILFLVVSSVTVNAQPREFPYHRNTMDFVLLPIGITTFITSEYLSAKRDNSLSINEIEALDRTNIHGFDRSATYNWSPAAADFSDVPFRTMPFLPIVLGIPLAKNKQWNNALTLGLIYTEVFLLTKGITGITKSITSRTRPYLYNTAYSAEQRFTFQDETAPNTSFFSGHSSATFAFAVLLSKTYTDLYGKNTWSKVIWGTSLSLAGATAYARVAAGVHFPTDVLVGAVVGSAIGYLIPELHKRKTEKLSLTIFPGYFSAVYTLKN